MIGAVAKTGEGEPPEEARHSWAVIVRLSWPLVLTMLANAGVGLLDTWIAGFFGAEAQAVVGLSMQLVLLINATTTAISVGAQALVARFVGARDAEQAALASRQALLFGAGLSLAVIPVVWLAAPALFAAMGAGAELQASGASYLRALLWGILPMDLLIVMSAILRARALTRVSLVGSLAETGVWATFSLLLGWLNGWGLSGLVAGFVAGKLAGFGVLAYFFWKMGLLHMAQSRWQIQIAWFRRIMRTGLPAGFQVVIRNAGMMAFYAILAMLPQATQLVAAVSIGFRIESVAFLPVFALNIAAATLVGQSLGAGRPEEAQRAAWRIVWLGTAILSAFGLIFLVGADWLAARFTHDPVVRGHAVDYLRIMAISEPFLAVAMVLNGALQGAGDAKAPMWGVIIFQIGVRVPLAFLLAVVCGMGSLGAWWAMTISLVAQAAGMVWYFRRGYWRERTV
jgi:MATE family multidrug resistance protein